MIGINLIDETVLLARRRRRIQRWALVTASAALIGAFPIGVELSRDRQVRGLVTERKDVKRRIETIRTEIAAVGAEIRTLEIQIARADALQTKRSWSRLFALLSRSLPEEMWLMTISTDPVSAGRGDVDLVSKTARSKRAKTNTTAGKNERQTVTLLAPRALVFEGYTMEHRSLYEFMSRLKSTNTFGDISLTKASEEAVFDASAIRFNIRCTW